MGGHDGKEDKDKKVRFDIHPVPHHAANAGHDTDTDTDTDIL